MNFIKKKQKLMKNVLCNLAMLSFHCLQESKKEEVTTEMPIQQ